MEQVRKQVEFNNPVFQKLLALKLNIEPKHLKYFVMPLVGDRITLGNVVYEITYVRERPFRFTAEPVAVLTEKEEEAICVVPVPEESISPSGEHPQQPEIKKD